MPAAEHVGQDDDAGTVIDGGDGIENVLSPLFHVVIGADRDRFDLLLRPDHMFQCHLEFMGELAVGNENQSDHLLPHSGRRLRSVASARRRICEGALSWRDLCAAQEKKPRGKVPHGRPRAASSFIGHHSVAVGQPGQDNPAGLLLMALRQSQKWQIDAQQGGSRRFRHSGQRFVIDQPCDRAYVA